MAPSSDIQNYIISRLKNADTLRYRDMKLSEVPNDLYNYHLKALLTKNLIVKSSTGYSLSDAGRRYVADIHHTSDQANRLFKINVITIVSRTTEHGIEILTQRRTSQPSYGMVDVMGGTILKGEATAKGANRKLEQETGLTADFRVVGIERRLLYKKDELFSDIIFPICYSDHSYGKLKETTEFGINFWVSIQDAIENSNRPYDNLSSITRTLRAIEAGRIDSLPFFFEETSQSNT